MNQNKISKETAILFAFFIVGILTIFGVPIWISIIIVFISAIFWALYSKTPTPPTPTTPTPTAPAPIPVWKKIPWTAVQAIIAMIIGIAIVIAFSNLANEMVKSERYEMEIDGNVTKVTLSSEVNAYNCYEIVAGGNGSMTVTYEPTKEGWPKRSEDFVLTSNATPRVSCYNNNVGEARAQMIITSSAEKFKLEKIIKK